LQPVEDGRVDVDVKNFSTIGKERSEVDNCRCVSVGSGRGMKMDESNFFVEIVIDDNVQVVRCFLCISNGVGNN